MSLFDIIIPTWNNPQYLVPCVQSIINTGVLQSGHARLIVVDNGDNLPVDQSIEKVANTVVLRTGKNLGWEGGLKAGLAISKSPLVCFQNDDTLIPKAAQMFYNKMCSPFNDDNVGIVGPATTTASGIQSVYNPHSPQYPVQVPWVIFFCAMLRRSYVDEIGGVDDTLPGGDDFDMCIRMNKLGKKILINPEAFIIHHGFVTGTRVHGDHTVKNGWNNIEFTDRVNAGLIKKHGFKAFIENRINFSATPMLGSSDDLEGNIIRSMVNGDKNIVELGCGGKKTIDRAVGVDRVEKGKVIPNLIDTLSVADVVADVREELPFLPGSQDILVARHILEHCLDSVSAIKNWKKMLRIGGKMILAVPDQKVINGIPMNPEHVHAYDEKSLSVLMEELGFRTIETKSSNNGISFVGCYERLN